MGWPPVVNAGLLGFIIHGTSDAELDGLQEIATSELGDHYEPVDPNTWIARRPEQGSTADRSEDHHDSSE
jgi:hypothetical protein